MTLRVSLPKNFALNFLKKVIEVELNYKVVLVSGVQQSGSVISIDTSIVVQIYFSVLVCKTLNK